MRRVVLIGGIVLITIALALGGALVYLNSAFGKRHILRLLNDTVLTEAGLRLGWEDVRGSFLYNFVVEDPYLVSIDGDTLVTAQALRVRLRPWLALEGDIELSRVEVDRPVVNILALPDRDEAARTKRAERDTSGTDGEPSSGFRIQNVVLRNGSVRWATKGPVNSARGVTLRGSIEFGGSADFQLDVRRLRGELLDWGLLVDDVQGQIILNHDFLWFIGTDITTRTSRLSANGNLDLKKERRAGNLFFDLRTQDLTEWWPIIGGDWAGNGALRLTGRMRGIPDEPEVEITGAGELGGVELTRYKVTARYRPGDLQATVTAQGPWADTLHARLSLNPDTGQSRLAANAVMLRLAYTPAKLPVIARQVDLELETNSFDPVVDGGRLTLGTTDTDLFGLDADSTALSLECRDGNVYLLEPFCLIGNGFALTTDGFVSVERGAVDLEVEVTTEEPSGIMGVAGIDFDGGTFHVDARVTGALDDPSLRGEVTATGLRQGVISVSGGSFTFNVARVLTSRIGTFYAFLDTLHVDPNIDLAGALLDGRVQGERVTLQLVTGWWEGGDVSLHGNIEVGGDSIRARLDSGRLTHNEMEIPNLRGNLAFDPNTGAGPFSLIARMAEGNARISGNRYEDNALAFAGDLERIPIGPISRSWLDSSVSIDGRVSGTVEGRITEHLDELSVGVIVSEPSVGDYRYRTLELDARYNAGTVQIDGITVTGEPDEDERAESAIISGDFRLPGTRDGEDQGALNLTATVESLNLDTFARYLGRTLTGTLSSDLTMGGSFREPEVTGTVHLWDAQVDTFQIEDVKADVRYLDERMFLEEGRLVSQGFEALYEGSMPMIISLLPLDLNVINDEPIDAVLRGEGTPDFLIQPIGEQIESVGGTLHADLRLSGALSAPALNGSFRWNDGTVKPAILGQRVSDIQVEIRLDEQEITIERFTGRLPSDLRQKSNLWNLWHLFGLAKRKDPGGDFAVSGTILLREGKNALFNLHLEGEELGLSDPTGSVLFVVDTDLEMQTRADNTWPTLGGTVQIQQGLADLGMLLNMIGAEGVETEEVVEDTPGLETDIEIEIPGRLRVIGGEFGQDVDIELMGNLIVRKNPTGAPYVLGTLETVPGRGQLTIFGYRWAVDEGTVTFGSIEEINPDLNARFSANAQDLLVYLDLTGTLREPQTRLSTAGNELTSQSALWELLTIGTIGISGQSGGRTEVISNYLERAASRTVRGILPFDELELEGLGGLGSGLLTEDLQVSVGRYFGRRMYAKYAQSFGGPSLWRELGVEYRFSRRFSLSGMRDRTGRYLFEVKWRIDY